MRHEEETIIFKPLNISPSRKNVTGNLFYLYYFEQQPKQTLVITKVNLCIAKQTDFPIEGIFALSIWKFSNNLSVNIFV